MFLAGQVADYADSKLVKCTAFLTQRLDPLDPILVAGEGLRELWTLKNIHLIVVEGLPTVEIDEPFHDEHFWLDVHKSFDLIASGLWVFSQVCVAQVVQVASAVPTFWRNEIDEDLASFHFYHIVDVIRPLA